MSFSATTLLGYVHFSPYVPWQRAQLSLNTAAPFAARFASIARGYFGGSIDSRYSRMSLKSSSAFVNAEGPLSGLIMNCISERAERTSPPPVWYMVFFFFSSHQAGVS